MDEGTDHEEKNKIEQKEYEITVIMPPRYTILRHDEALLGHEQKIACHGS